MPNYAGKMSIELEPLCTLHVVLRDPIPVGAGPMGMRLIFEVESAEVRGDRINGKLLGSAAADWLLVQGNVATLDIRATVQTDDGALIYAAYTGRTTLGPDLAPGPLFVAPLFETGDERYLWLNSIQAVGKGIVDGHDLHYEWYEMR